MFRVGLFVRILRKKLLITSSRNFYERCCICGQRRTHLILEVIPMDPVLFSSVARYGIPQLIGSWMPLEKVIASHSQ